MAPAKKSLKKNGVPVKDSVPAAEAPVVKKSLKRKAAEVVAAAPRRTSPRSKN